MIQTYIDLLAERSRLEMLDAALKQTVRKGDVVVDVGTGTGAFAIMAARHGARRVYAIEYDEIADLAASLVQANGLSDIITVLRMDATVWTPPEPLDVVVYEDVEDVGIGATLAALIPRLRTFMRPEGRFVPNSVSVWAAPVENAAEHRQGFPWPEARAYGIDLSPLSELAHHMRSNCHLDRASLLSEPEIFFRYAFGEPLPDHGQAQFSFVARRAGPLHGVLVWFDAQFAAGLEWTNAPSNPQTFWRQSFFHVRDAPRVEEGDQLTISLTHAPWSSDAWMWNWDISIRDRGGKEKYCGEHSSFRSQPLSVEQLTLLSPDRNLEPGPASLVLRRILELFDGTRTAREIGTHLVSEFPDRFANVDRAAEHVLRTVAPLSQNHNNS